MIDFSSVVDSLTGVVGKYVTKDKDLQKVKGDIKIALRSSQVALEQEITKRWEADNKSDSVLTKNIRPLSLIGVTLFFMIYAFYGGDDESVYDLLTTLLPTMYLAYFGGRSYEKSR